MRSVISGIVGVIILLVIAWLGFWFYAEMRVKQIVTAKIEQLNSTGNEKIIYAKLVTGNSPLTASVTLVQPNISVQLNPTIPAVNISATRIGAHVDLLNPLTLVLDIPLSISMNYNGVSEVLTFKSAQATEALSPSVWLGNATNPILGGESDFSGINLLTSNGSLQVVQIGRLSTHTTTNAQANNSQTALAFTCDIQNVQISPILTRLFNIPFNGAIGQLSTSLTLSGPLNWEQLSNLSTASETEDQRTKALLQAMHGWAQADGHAQGSLNLQLGPSLMQTNFTLGFDQQTQPKGTMNIFANHLGQFFNEVASAYPGTQDWINQIVTVLGPYLSNTAQDGQTLNLNTLYGHNGVFINGQKMADMPKLNWNNTLGTLALPNLAPGDGSGAASQ